MTRRVIALVVVISLWLAGQALAADDTAGPQVDGSHTGAVTGDAMAPPLSLLWSTQLGDFVEQPLLAGGRVFAVAGHDASSGAVTSPGDSTLFAFDAGTGAVLWSRQQTSGELAFDSGRVFAAGYDPGDIGTLEAFAADSGAPLWSTALPRTNIVQIVADGGTVFAVLDDDATETDRVVALDEGTGRTFWSEPVGADFEIAVDRTAVYEASGCTAYAYSRSFGSRLWATGGPSPACMAIDLFPSVYRGRVYSRAPSNTTPATADNTVFDAATGRVVGHGFPAVFAPAFSGRHGYFNDGETLRSVDLETGAVAWAVNAPAGTPTFWADSPVLDNGSIYELQTDGTLRALATSTGAVQWQTQALPADAVGPAESATTLAIGQGLLAVSALSGQLGEGQLEVYGDPDAGAPALENRLPAVAICVVPRLAGATPAAARRELAHAHCALGRIDEPRHPQRGTRLRATGSSPRAGTRAPAGAAISVRLRPV
ncbi:MAG TPA: PQQ-binding-like beta-propeller repeat protein [Solirubrobacteraceae bacterium]|nr:PQQ-binding-like beta-propeller repeat protein [Solirubrobacteraceae bacterium]